MKFFTIGYGGAEPEALVEILKENGVRAVVDVRLWPHRASMGSYVLSKSPEKGIRHLLAKQGIQYHSFIELGNSFLQFPDWRRRYRQLLSSAGDLLTERLLEISEPCCLLCAEKQPLECHRSIIGEFLIERGHHIEHVTIRQGPIPLISIRVPSDIWSKVGGSAAVETPENKLALSDFGERVLMQANRVASVCSQADAAGEAMENWPGMFFGKSLGKIRPPWYLHAALVGQEILLRAGHWDLRQEGYAPENVEYQDDALRVFEENLNEVWIHIFQDHLQEETLIRHLGKDLLRVKFKKMKQSSKSKRKAHRLEL